jgi:Flp pilus assembly protein TadB
MKILCFPACFTWWLILLCFAIIAAAIVTGLAAGPAYLIIIVIFMISIARFFCGSKKSNQTEAQKKLVEDKLEQKRNARSGQRNKLTTRHLQQNPMLDY